MAKPQQQPTPKAEVPLPLPPSAAFTLWTGSAGSPTDLVPLLPVLTVLHLTCSGRHVKCQLGEHKDIVCQVGNATNFRAKMEIRGAFMRPPFTDARLWVYAGKLPRRSGHW